MLLPLTLLIVSISSLTAASPVPPPPTVRIKADNYVEVKCRSEGKFSHVFTAAHQRAAVRQLIHYANVPNKDKLKSWGGKEQPHKYNAGIAHVSPAVDEMLNLMPECSTTQTGKTWFLYPLLEGGVEFRGLVHEGPDRVLVVADGTGNGPFTNFVYCGAVFHPRENDSSFETCHET